MMLFVSMTIMAQTRAGDSSPKEPQGATYTLSDGSTVTKTGENINSETQYSKIMELILDDDRRVSQLDAVK